MMLDAATADALDSARAILARRPGLADARAELDKVEAGLRGRVRVALVGRVSAGKSTLTNALLGGSRAPTGAQELTFHVTWIRHGLRPALAIHFRGGRAPQPDDVESLARHVRRSDADREGVIDHLEVTDPAPYLRSFDLIDTPGLDSVFGVESADTLRFLDGRIDALVLVVNRGLHVREAELLAEFRGQTIGPSPVNAIAALTKIELLWHRRTCPDPVAAGREIAAQWMSVPAVRGVVHEVFPVASLAAAACAVLTEEGMADLRALSTVAPDKLVRWAGSPDTFVAPGPVETGLPPERRAALWRAFSAYGLVLACGIVRAGATDRAGLRAEMDKRSGMAALRRALVEHFGSRAELVMLNGAYTRIQSLPMRFGAGRSVGEVAVLRAAAREFATHALTRVPRFRELDVLRDYYAGRVELAEDDAAELLRVVGEAGEDVRARLGLPPGTPIAEVRSRARARMEYWRERQILGGASGATREAIRVLMRALERIVDTVEDVRWKDA
jgi:hypothetical protein